MSAASIANSSMAGNGDYRALVCIMLGGGNDSYNMLVPNDSDTYAAYANIRSDLALPREDLLPLSMVSLGLLPSKKAYVNTTASAVLSHAMSAASSQEAAS